MKPGDLHEAKKIARLIIKHLGNDLTAAEKEELEDWICASADNMELFEKLTDEDHIEESMNWFRKLDEQVLAGKSERRITRRTKLRPLYWAAAAIIVIGFGYWLFNYKASGITGNEKTIAIALDSVIPGDYKALLTTSSGKKIELGQQKISRIDLGSNTFAQEQNNELVYNNIGISSNNMLYVPAGGQYKIVLSDGTKVWLNSLSVLKYPTAFNGHSRQVELEGEAYFEVAENKSKPFSVKILNASVQVTGTKFNISSYASEQEERITLLEGAVNLVVNGKTISMKPGQDGVVSENNIVSVSNNIAADESIAWTKGLFSFNKTPIEEVMNQISRWYNVKVIYEGRPPKQFTGNIPMKSDIKTALQMLELSGSVHLTLSGKTITVRP